MDSTTKNAIGFVLFLIFAWMLYAGYQKRKDDENALKASERARQELQRALP